MEPYVIRAAVQEDIETLVALRQRQLQDEGALPKEDISQSLRDYFHGAMADGSFAGFVAETHGEIIATGGCTFYRVPPHYGNTTGLIAQVANMHTLRPYRRQGIAKAVLTKVIAEASRRGYHTVRVTASKEGAFLYRSCGFAKKDNLFELLI